MKKSRPLRSRQSLAPWLTVACSVLIAATARGDVAVLPAQGAPAITAKVDLRVSQGIAEQGYRKVLTPLSVRSRLRDSDVVSKASVRLSKARDAIVYMKRESAIAAARAALDALGPFAVLHSPQLVARARGMLALALLLRPADEPGAQRELQRALAADPTYRPGEDYSSSQVRRHLARAQSTHRQRFEVPVGLAKQLTATELISIMVKSKAETGELRVVLRDERGEPKRRLSEKAVPIAELPARALALATQILNELVPAPAAAKRPTTVVRSKRKTQREAPRRRLWTWIAAGGAAAAAAVGLGLGLSATSDHDDWQSLKKEGQDYDAWVSLADSGKDKTLAANILFGVAGALVVTATVLFFVEPGKRSERKTVSFEKRPTVALTPTGVIVQHAF